MHYIKLDRNLSNAFTWLAELNSARARVLYRGGRLTSGSWPITVVGPRLVIYGMIYDLGLQTSQIEVGPFDERLLPYQTAIPADDQGSFNSMMQAAYTRALRAGLQLELRPDRTIAIRGNYTNTHQIAITALVNKSRSFAA